MDLNKICLVVVASLSSFLVWYNRMLPAIMFDEIAYRVSVDPEFMGFYGATFFLGFTASHVAILLIRWKVKPVLFVLFGIIVMSFGSFGHGFAGTIAGVCACRTVIGIGAGAIVVPVHLLLKLAFDNPVRGRIQCLVTAVGALGGMFSLGPLAQIVKMDNDFALVFLVFGGIGIATAVLALLLVRANSWKVEENALSDIILVTSGDRNSTESRPMFGSLYSYAFIAYFACGPAVFFNFMSLWIGPYLTQFYAYSMVDGGYIAVIGVTGYLLGALMSIILWGRVERILLIFASVFSLTAVLVLMLTDRDIQNTLLFVAIFLLGFGAMGPAPVVMTVLESINCMLPVVGICIQNALTMLLQMIASAGMMTNGTGGDLDRKDFAYALWIPACICVIASGVMIFFMKKAVGGDFVKAGYTEQ